MLGLIISNYRVMAMKNLNDEISIKNEIATLYLEKTKLMNKLSYCFIYHLDDDFLQKKLNNLECKMKKLSRRIYDIENLNSINEQIRRHM
ncbi:effector protein, partial [Candidatus Phytoplasma aurantifolia]|nr:effector protein [Candidatus Phytoplasma aurantifolia]